MIMHEPGAGPRQPGPAWGRATLDGILRKNAKDYPDRIALVDDPDREQWNAAPAQELTFAEADRRVDALAGFFRIAGLQPDAMIAIDAPPTTDTVIILLAALRAGLIVFPVPALWTRKDCMTILSPVAPQAVIVTSVTKGESRAERLRDVADTIRSARLVFGYGGALPGGVLDLAASLRPDDILPAPRLEREGEPGDHVATVTANGGAPVATQLHVRSHRHWLASALSLVLEARLREGATFLLPYALSGLTGIGAGVVPWLLTAGTLRLHRFDRLARLVAHARDVKPAIVILPGDLAAPFTAGRKEDDDPLVGAVWKDEHPDSVPAADGGIVDITSIDELAFAVRRRERKDVSALPVGPVHASGDTALLEIRVDGHPHKARERHATLLGGLLSLRGMAVPTARSIPVRGSEPAPTGVEVGSEGFVRTDIACRLVDGPMRGIVPVGRRDRDRPDAAHEENDAPPDGKGMRVAG